MGLLLFGLSQSPMRLLELLNDRYLLGTFLQARAALLAQRGVALAGNQPFIAGLSPLLEFINAPFIHELKNHRYVHPMLTGQTISTTGAV